MSPSLGTIDWDSVLYGLNFSDSWDTFAENIIKLAEANEPVSKASRESVKRSPYVNNHCLPAIKKQELQMDEIPGPGCSKLTTSLVNVSLKFQTLISEIRRYFWLKKCEKCKSFSHFVNNKYQCI